MGVHSALAIKRQRKRRDEQRRARDRRFSVQSTESGFTSPSHSPLASAERLEARRGRGRSSESPGVSSIGMLHIGVVFLVLGIFLLGAGILPEDITEWNDPSAWGHGWWNELVCTGLFAVVLGVFLIILNKFLSRREEEDLEDYVQRQLTRSRSGHRLERDVETGVLTTRHARRAQNALKDLNSSAADLSGADLTPVGPTSPRLDPQPLVLEQILEETTPDSRSFVTSNLSPVSPSDTKLLLKNGYPAGLSV